MEDELTSFSKADRARREAGLEARARSSRAGPGPKCSGCPCPRPGPGTRLTVDQKQLPRIHRQPAEERQHPTAPFAGQAPARQIFLAGFGLERGFNSGKRLVRFCFWENPAERRRSRKGSRRISGHEFPKRFRARTPLILVPWDQTRNEAQRIK